MIPRLAVIALLLSVALPAAAENVEALTAETKKAVLPVVPKVVATMQETVAAKGATEAIPVCKEEAPRLIREVRESTGWSIRRVSLKPRNAERGTPDLWEARVLANFNIRAAAGERPDTIEHAEVVNEDGRRYLRYMKALPTGDVCLKCHGPAESLDADLKTRLKASYADDQAVGYTKGQIRGALTVKRPL